MIYQTTVCLFFFPISMFTHPLGWPDLYILTTPLVEFFYSESPWQLSHGCHVLVFHSPLLTLRGSVVVDLEELGRSRWPPLKMNPPPHYLHRHYHHQGGKKMTYCLGPRLWGMVYTPNDNHPILIKAELTLCFSSTYVNHYAIHLIFTFSTRETMYQKLNYSYSASQLWENSCYHEVIREFIPKSITMLQ